MHKKTAPFFVHYGEPEKIEKSFAFNVDIFMRKTVSLYLLKVSAKYTIIKLLYFKPHSGISNFSAVCGEESD